jgi:hypothetical protein
MSTRAPYGDDAAGCAPGHAAAPAPDVDRLALHRRNPSRYPFLLESVAAGTPQSRFDLLLAFPGAGIVADYSVPERELEETRHKAHGLALALARAMPERS